MNVRGGRALGLSLSVALLVQLFQLLPAYAAVGDLDTTFSGDGKILAAIGSADDGGNAMAIQTDGKIVVAGYSSNGTNDDFAVARFTAAGALDTTFSSDGKVSFPILSSDDRVLALALQGDGSIVVAGYAYNGTDDDFALARLTSSGALDTTFSGDGKLTTQITPSSSTGNDDDALGVTIQGDGKIVAVGQTWTGTTRDYALARYNSDGSLDATFDGDGKLNTDIAGKKDVAQAVTIQSDGKILVVGSSNTGSWDDYSFARYLPSGGLDTAFNGDGKATVPIGSSIDGAYAVKVQSDGAILTAGYTLNSTYDSSFVRLTSSGALDTTFSGDGKQVVDIAGQDDEASALMLQSDGKFVAAGYSGTSNADYALTRFTSAGSLDTTFSGDGKVVTPIGAGADYAFGAALQSDGKIVAAGESMNGSYADFSVARFQGDGTTLPSLTVSDVTVTEADTTTVGATFNVKLSTASTQTVTVNYATANGSAVAPGDYLAASGTVSFAPGEVTKPVTVTVQGDTADEADETFDLNLSSAVNATIADDSGRGTITDNDPTPVVVTPSMVINDVTVTEGDSGTSTATLTATLSATSTSTVTANFATANGTATAPGDYTATSGTISFAAGTLSKTITVPIVGDTVSEASEVFYVDLSSLVGATLSDGQGAVTITDNDSTVPTTPPSLTINDVSVTEGDDAAVSASFTVSLSAASTLTISANHATANGTATAPGDYTAGSGSLSFAPGQTSKTVTVPVQGDTEDEPNETFAVNLSGAVNATIADSQGVGTIVDDDDPAVGGVHDVGVAQHGFRTQTQINTKTHGWGPFSIRVDLQNYGTVSEDISYAVTSSLPATLSSRCVGTVADVGPGRVVSISGCEITYTSKGSSTLTLQVRHNDAHGGIDTDTSNNTGTVKVRVR